MRKRTTLSVVVGALVASAWAAPAPAVPETQLLSSGTISAPVPDAPSGGQLYQQFSPPDVTRGGLIRDVDVRIRLDHPDDDQVRIFLIHSAYPLGGGPPVTTTLELSSDNGGTGANYGTGPTGCDGTLTEFDDEAATPVTAGSAPFAGAYRPEQPLSTIDGRSSAGRWTLTVIDDTAGGAGTLYCWELEIETDFCPGAVHRLGTHVVGGPGPQVMAGTDLRDVMCGLGGKDRILGLGGRDRLLGGGGRDVLKGGNNGDTCRGGPGRDKIKGCSRAVQ